MAVMPVAQPTRDSLVALLAGRALDVLKDAGFQRVLRQEGYRFLVVSLRGGPRSLAADLRAVSPALQAGVGIESIPPRSGS